MPQPPYVLLFEEVEPDARPFAVLVGERAAVPALRLGGKGGGAFW